MRKLLIILICLLIIVTTLQLKAREDPQDPYLWLEEIKGEKALKWVKKQNKESTAELESVPGFKKAYAKSLEIFNSREKIPYINKIGDYFYNFWRDDQYMRGVIRRTTLAEYRGKNPKWEIILNFDVLAKEEGESWVYAGSSRPHSDPNRWLLYLSRGGSDAVVIREWDVRSRSFVKDGFQLPEGKNSASWRDKDSLLVCADFGKGSLTTSGYPRTVRLWKRGTPLKEAKTIFEVDETSVSASARRLYSGDDYIEYLREGRTFFERYYYLFKDGKRQKINIPRDAYLRAYFKKQLIILLKSDWKVEDKTYKEGSLIAGKLDDIMAGKKKFHVLMEPGEHIAIHSIRSTRNILLVTVLDNVVSKLYQFTRDESGKWHKKQVDVEDNGTLRVFSTNQDSDNYFMTYQNLLTPTRLYMVSGQSGNLEKLKSLPAFFNAQPCKVRQLQAVSKDGTRIPYFIVMRKDAEKDGQNPTQLIGYGGFMGSVRPYYSGVVGVNWLEKGGVYVLANIRGGGEFGPRWHKAGLKKNRHKVFEDFIAVAEDLIKRKITSPAKLGISGASNGGLLVGVVSLMRPDLFNAVVCGIPLLDMKRYHKLLAGASWIAEYGNPDDPDMWEYIKTYSPYHNVKKKVKYPKIFFYTSSRDDRVHPGHARKMAAKMTAMGHDVLFYESIEGGHGGSVHNKQAAYTTALRIAYLYRQLMDK